MRSRKNRVRQKNRDVSDLHVRKRVRRNILNNYVRRASDEERKRRQKYIVCNTAGETC